MSRAYEDRVIQLANEFKDRVAFVAINSNDPTQYPEDSFENMKRIAQEKNYPFPYLFDETQSVARAYKASRTPEFFVFDEERDLKYHGRFDDNWEHPNQVRHEYVRDAIRSCWRTTSRMSPMCRLWAAPSSGSTKQRAADELRPQPKIMQRRKKELCEFEIVGRL
jgi:hypothetical protein